MRFVIEVPWFPPGLAVALVVATLLAGRLGRRLDVPPVLGWVLIASLGMTLALTLTPLREALDFGAVGSGRCDLSRVGLAPLSAFRGFNDTSLNVLVLIPFGTAIGLLPRSKAKAAIVVAAILLPVAIETIQLLLPILDRGCQSADVIDNLTGLALGGALGSVAGWLGGHFAEV